MFFCLFLVTDTFSDWSILILQPCSVKESDSDGEGNKNVKRRISFTADLSKGQ